MTDQKIIGDRVVWQRMNQPSKNPLCKKYAERNEGGVNCGHTLRKPSICGGHLTADNAPQTIYSHTKFSDLDYESNQQCYWTITPKLENHTVLLRFLYFEVEEETLCTLDELGRIQYDYLRIFDGADTKGKLLGGFCGRTLPNTFLSNSGQLYLQFVSDDTVGSKGFQAQYQMIPYGYKLPKHEIDSQALINQVATSTSSSSVYYGKNEMLQQYQPFHGNRYLFPPAWGTGRIRYFGDTRHSDMMGNYQSTRPFQHHKQAYQQHQQQQQSAIRQTYPTVYPRNSFYPRHNERFSVNREENSQLPWRFAYTYPQQFKSSAMPMLNKNRFAPRPPYITYNLHSPNSVVLKTRLSSPPSLTRPQPPTTTTTPKVHTSSLLSQGSIYSQKPRIGRTWHVRPGRVVYQPQLSIINRIIQPTTTLSTHRNQRNIIEQATKKNSMSFHVMTENIHQNIPHYSGGSQWRQQKTQPLNSITL